jgi:hypothetical protein
MLSVIELASLTPHDGAHEFYSVSAIKGRTSLQTDGRGHVYGHIGTGHALMVSKNNECLNTY